MLHQRTVHRDKTEYIPSPTVLSILNYTLEIMLLSQAQLCEQCEKEAPVRKCDCENVTENV